MKAIDVMTGKAGEPCTRGDVGAARVRADRLPCLFSHNCTETPFALSPSQRKTAYSLAENVDALIALYGLSHVAFLTLTFPRNLGIKEANRRFHSLATHVLPDVFDLAWVATREWSWAWRLHFHLIGACSEDLRDGFHFPNYVKMLRISKSKGRRARAGEVRALSRALNPSPALRARWNLLRSVLPRYQFGRHELIPIRKSGKAVARYVGGYLQKGLGNRPDSAKGSRIITYSRNFPRRVVSHAFQWHTPNTALWRRKLAVFARLHRIKDFSELSKRYGPRWAFWFRDVIETLNVGDVGEQLKVCPELAERLAVAVTSFPPAREEPRRMHIVPPRPPLDDDGKAYPVPRALAWVFEWHSRMWGMPIPENRS